MLGGSLLLTKPLVYRSIHGGNEYLADYIFASSQDKGRYDGAARTALCVEDVLAAIRGNGGEQYLPKPSANGGRRGAPGRRKRSLPQRLARSFRKRWDRWNRREPAAVDPIEMGQQLAEL